LTNLATVAAAVARGRIKLPQVASSTDIAMSEKISIVRRDRMKEEAKRVIIFNLHAQQELIDRGVWRITHVPPWGGDRGVV
jgi:hypothetical protein